jgi:diguanylate cyclase (GGDEF)-like protein
MTYQNLYEETTISPPKDPFDPLEGTYIRVTLLVLPLGVLMCFAVWGVLALTEQRTLAAHIVLPIMGVGLGGLFLALRRHWLRLNTVWMLCLGAIGLLNLLELLDQTLLRSQFGQSLGPAALWYPLPYLLAFSLLPYRRAYRLVLVYFLLGFGIVFSGFFTNRAANGADALEAVDISLRVQFLLFNMATIALFWLVASLRRTFDAQYQRSYSDPLTGLNNRRALEPVLEREMLRAQRYGTPLSLMLIDIDHFKTLNEQEGRVIGDAVLREVASRLALTLRKNDCIARWNGQEFLILAPETDLERAAILAERLLEVVRVSTVVGHALTLSVGISSYQGGDSQEELLARVDSALYRAKNRGRNRAEVVASRPRLNTVF